LLFAIVLLQTVEDVINGALHRCLAAIWIDQSGMDADGKRRL